jgi:hypothetical protein
MRRNRGGSTVRSRASAAVRFTSGPWLADWGTRLAARQAIERRDTEARLRKELGRPPWPGEIDDALR